MVEILLPLPAKNNKKSLSTRHPTRKSITSKPKKRNPIPEAELITDHWNLATGLAASYRNIPGVDFDDIVQHARLALTKAARTFDPAKGAAFSTFAWCSIRNELNSLYVRQRKHSTREFVTLPTSTQEDDEQFLLDSIASPDDDVTVILFRNEMHAALHESIKSLPSQLRRIILAIMANREYKEIGRKLGFSQASAKTLVSRGYRRALTLLKTDLERKGFDSSID